MLHIISLTLSGFQVTTEIFKFSPTEIKELCKSNKEDGETLNTIVMLQCCIIILLLHIYLRLCIGTMVMSSNDKCKS